MKTLKEKTYNVHTRLEGESIPKGVLVDNDLTFDEVVEAGYSDEYYVITEVK